MKKRLERPKIRKNMSNDKKYNKTKDKIYKLACRNCNAVTNHKVLTSVENNWGDDDIPMYGTDVSEIVECLGCDSISFRLTSTNSENIDGYNEETGDFEYTVDEELYPNRIAGRKVIENTYLLPTKTLNIYKEVHKALCSRFRILAGIGIRVIVESVCREKEAKGPNLENKIDDLVNKGLLTKENAEALHATRLLGNKLAHEFIESRDEELEIAMDIVENLLMSVYIIPEKTKRLKIGVSPKKPCQ
ncbi:MAG: DUF4145 domain-containing protein [bacterium]|nr:DUF4145 domain-containing protein [bacterium]